MLKNGKNNIALTGLMGSGKSTVGKFLASQLRKKFIDTDLLIENKEGLSVSQIFETKGEKYFREAETNIINEICAKDDQVISLGGGAVVNAENRNMLKQNSILIALVAEPNDLFSRIKRRRNRPLLNDSKDQLAVLEKLWAERKDFYYDSDFQIDTTNKSINNIGIEIMEVLGLQRPRFQEQHVTIHRSNFSYNIYFKELDRLNISSINPGKQVLIVTQEPVAKHFLATIVEKLSNDDFNVNVMKIPDGEDAKNFLNYQLILQRLLTLNFERKDTLIALGGGVVGDIVGFAASTYYRGINYVQIPTTLLSMVDSSVGGKTAINVPEGKNLIGSFYQPHMVHIDVANLSSLSDAEYKSGLGEVVKYTLLGEKWDTELGDSFFNFVSANADAIADRDPLVLNQVIYHCLLIKSGIVGKDETEKGIRAHLNLGHTFAHALEEVTKYKRYSHGQAVAIGLVCACYLAEELAVFRSEMTRKVIELLKTLEMEYKIPDDIKTETLMSTFKYDKKNEGGLPKFIVPKGILGRVEILDKINIELARAAIDRNRL